MKRKYKRRNTNEHKQSLRLVLKSKLNKEKQNKH